LLTVSCSDDFVNRDPVYSIDSENYFNSKRLWKCFSSCLWSTSIIVCKRNVREIASDNIAGGESQTDVIGFQQIDDMIHTPVNKVFERYLELVSGVSRANYILISK
jgi:hypothetical protein